ncbi:MAG: flagellar filament capping protein FliD [Arcobacteraceae bacterium]
MAEGILGLGSSGSAGLSMELIEKLKNAERKGQVDPIEKRIENWDTEVEQFGEIEAKINDILNASKKFDLFNNNTNVFSEVYAKTSGTAASFDATDTSNLKPGTINVTVSQLAQKDVFMSNIIANKDTKMGVGTIKIKVDEVEYSFSTKNKSYATLVAEMNTFSKLDVGLEKVNANEYRMVIKSSESGLDNAITIKQSGAASVLGLGNIYNSQANTFVGTSIPASGEKISFTDGTNDFSFTADGIQKYQDVITAINTDGKFTATLVDGQISIESVTGKAITITTDTMLGLQNNGSHTQKAQNMLANVDGIDYNLSGNKIIMQSGLTIAALELGNASVAIQRDTAGIESAFKDLITNYNDMVDLVTNYTIGADSKIEDKSTIRSILTKIKDIIFGTEYGNDKDKSLFSYGVDLDKSGYLSLDSAVFNKAVAEDFSGLKSILVGSAEEKGRGIGTKIKEYLDELDGFGGQLTSYGDNMTTRRASLETEKKKAIEFLDNKYSQMAMQFAAYTAIISQFENAFGGLKMMIAQSVSGN